ncbi:CLUMA_CG015995, isoform A [Clunio marinus]|uniref:CLUMA_CG015995, isoform A n=1 Tax=Clunio marinus TaxID=568069 RepID=A0A1J1ISA5_9DIPT|nr:CLUMA_CG015995, isoform A [Clunio marinus]
MILSVLDTKKLEIFTKENKMKIMIETKKNLDMLHLCKSPEAGPSQPKPLAIVFISTIATQQ